MRRLVMVLSFVALPTVVGCESGPVKRIRKYVEATTAAGRYEHICKNPQITLADVQTIYAPLTLEKWRTTGTKELTKTNDGDSVRLSVDVETPKGPRKMPYWLSKRGGKWCVDWLLTGYGGRHEVGFKELFHGKARTEPILAYVRVKLGDYYNFEFGDAKESHYSLEFEARGDTFYGYLSKKAPGAQAIFDRLKGGGSAWIRCKLRYPPTRRDFAVLSMPEAQLVVFGRMGD